MAKNNYHSPPKGRAKKTHLINNNEVSPRPISSKAKKKSKGGRPSKYKAVYCDKLIEFFDIEPYEDIELPHYKKGEISWIDKKRVSTRLPTLRKFAKNIGVAYRTVYNWTKAHEGFLHAFTHAQVIRKEYLIDGALAGLYMPLTFKFIAVNMTDMRDKQDHEVSGDITVIIKKQ